MNLANLAAAEAKASSERSGYFPAEYVFFPFGSTGSKTLITIPGVRLTLRGWNRAVALSAAQMN